MTVIYRKGKFYILEKIKRSNRKTKQSVYSILASNLEKQKRAEKQKEFSENLLAPNDIEGLQSLFSCIHPCHQNPFPFTGILVIVFLIHLDLLKPIFSVSNN